MFAILTFAAWFVAQAHPPAEVIGTWRGTSVCVDRVAAPGCNDETLVYDITAGSTPGVAHWKAYKVVNGQNDLMGEMDLTYSDADKCWAVDFTSPRTSVRWCLSVVNGTMSGSAWQLPGKQRIRKVDAKRSQGLPPSGGRPDAPVDGVLTTPDGRPLAEVDVSGSLHSLRGIPFTSDTTRSDADGHFHLDHPGTVLHFLRADLRPHSRVITAADTDIRVSLETAADNIVTRACESATKPGKEIAGVYARFRVSDRSMRISGGKTDVDYTLFVIREGRRGSALELWFGPYAMSGMPSDDLFVNSSMFRERAVVTAKGDLIGHDSWGTLKSGKRWRQTSIASEGAIYESASPQEAESFDRIINSICVRGLEPLNP